MHLALQSGALCFPERTVCCLPQMILRAMERDK